MVKLIPLGGLGEIGLNMMAVESAETMFVIDAGLNGTVDIATPYGLNGSVIPVEFDEPPSRLPLYPNRDYETGNLDNKIRGGLLILQADTFGLIAPAQLDVVNVKMLIAGSGAHPNPNVAGLNWAGVYVVDQPLLAGKADEALAAHPADQSQPDLSRNFDATGGETRARGQRRQAHHRGLHHHL